MLAEQLSKRRDEQRERDLAEYGALVRKGVAAPLVKRESERLEALMTALGFGYTDLKQHETTVIQAATLTEGCRDLDADRAALGPLLGEISSQNTADRVQMLSAQERIGERTARLRNAELKVAGKERIAQQLAELTARETGGIGAWVLLGLPDPSRAARKRHLMIVPRSGPTPRTDCDIINVASVFGAKEYRLDLHEFIPGPGQTQEQLDELLHVCKEWLGGRSGQPTFLFEGAEPDVSAPQLLICFDQTLRAIKAAPDWPPFDPMTRHFVPLPGQDRARLAEMVEQLINAFRRNPAVRQHAARQGFESKANIVGYRHVDEGPTDDRPTMLNR